MKAKIKDLGYSKYYGTQIEILDGECEGHIIKVWLPGNPSEREIENWKRDQIEQGIKEEDFEPIEICDDHYESEMSYKVAQKIVEALKSL
jgi:hypothetical protein